MVDQISYEYTDKAVSPWGGMRLMKELIDRTGILKKLKELDIPQPGSNRGFKGEQIMESFCVSVWTGASRFVHSGWLRYDEVLREIFRWERVPSECTYGRFFNKFSWKRNTDVFVPLNRWFFNQQQLDRVTLDVDSSVFTRYGEQEGSKRGFNPTKPGRTSHHPILAFMPEMRMVVNAWLRPGNTGSSSSLRNFLDETLEILQDKKVGMLRADSGFYGKECLNYFEHKSIPYIVSAKLNKPLKWELVGDKNWINIAEGIHVCEFMYQAHGWSSARRYVAVRQQISVRPKATGKRLFTDEELGGSYRYSAYVTNMELSADQIWHLYRNRADAENRIKELKYDFAMDSFCLKRFWATEAAFRSIMVAYNLMSLFRHLVLKTKTQATLSTLKFKCFAIGSWIAKHAGKKILKLSVSGKKRLWLDGLFSNVSGLAPPYQFSNA